MKKRKKKIITIIIGLLAIAFLGVNAYLVNYAFVRDSASLGAPAAKKAKILKKDQAWLKQVSKQTWTEKSYDGKLTLKATYVPATKKTNKTIVIAHGYRENSTRMASYIRMFHDLGYNVLAPDDRAAGRSEGTFITFGWLDRLDYKKWLNEVIAKNGKNSEIGLFGVSMGGATVMMLSGEKLPKQVKVIVEDCGYSSIYEELGEQLTAQFGLPKEPILTTASWLAHPFIGFNFKEGSATAQLKKNNLPTLFIHGSKDTFVPTRMVYQNYQASKGKKELWVVKGAAHGMSYYEDPSAYTKKVGDFMAKYLK
ncbi:alpha/beta hydrolase [Ligilactobacillus apodemi]|uniref:Cell surface hydrolase, membrane-bound n=1 Tax=Ligilactobacillus apodemi DSM 16634 = JCM 16172 TaxID=1423724 RepID=A0A0R1U353_9LACO|nr:alpha/beta hydrolase [Ligilactobacillus apodemi]KRL84155.1 cell surface hydrolase, membrane-bound [Ligilactobacillus apodemi DSM 16634 = JCM 16172]